MGGALVSLNVTYWVVLLVAAVPADSLRGWFSDHFWDPFILLGPGHVVSGVLAGALPNGVGYTLSTFLGVIGTIAWTLTVAWLMPQESWVHEGLMWFCSPFWFPQMAIITALTVFFRGVVAARIISRVRVGASTRGSSGGGM